MGRERVFTQQSFRSAADESSGGNLGVDELIRAMVPDLDRWFGDEVRRRGGQWTAPGAERGEPTCPGRRRRPGARGLVRR